MSFQHQPYALKVVCRTVFWFSTGNGANLRDRMVCGLFVLLRGSQENRKSAPNCQQILDIREAADRIVTSRGSVAEFLTCFDEDAVVEILCKLSV